jgi:hypothetical protein
MSSGVLYRRRPPVPKSDRPRRYHRRYIDRYFPCAHTANDSSEASIRLAAFPAAGYDGMRFCWPGARANLARTLPCRVTKNNEPNDDDGSGSTAT